MPLHYLPQSMASPNFALSRSAFSEVILTERATALAPEQPQHVAAAEGEVVLRLRVWWVSERPRRGSMLACRVSAL